MSILKFAFAGFRHSHIFSLYDKVKKHPDLEIVAVCEENFEESLLKGNSDITLTHSDYRQMLDSVECDVVAIGDYYAKRGQMAIEALRRGKHVIADKPLCTSLKELVEIESLARQKNLKVGCMYELHSLPAFSTAREIIADGLIGKVTQIGFTGQHPLSLKTRPHWYFEPGKHGGTINDIAVHAVDFIPWVTGEKIAKPLAARTWQAFDCQCDCFNDAAQLMLVLQNGCGVIGDVSYAAPDTIGGRHCAYWRFNIWGTKGMLEFSIADKFVKAYFNGKSDVCTIAPTVELAADYLETLLADIAGKAEHHDTASVIESMRWVLQTQELADSTSQL